MRFFIQALLTLVVSALPLLAQTFPGRILGTVTDPAGAVIPAATVRVTSLGTNRPVVVQTNEMGNYAVSNLERGEYQIEVTALGFKKSIRRGMVLELQQHAKVDFTLEVGEVSQSLEVVAAAPLLETADSTLGKVVDNQLLQVGFPPLRSEPGGRACGPVHD
jgi:hypothetical protein